MYLAQISSYRNQMATSRRGCDVICWRRCPVGQGIQAKHGWALRLQSGKSMGDRHRLTRSSEPYCSRWWETIATHKVISWAHKTTTSVFPYILYMFLSCACFVAIALHESKANGYHWRYPYAVASLWRSPDPTRSNKMIVNRWSGRWQ